MHRTKMGSFAITILLLSTTHGWGATTNALYNFTGSSDGAYPVSNLVADDTGTLYGTTSSGGIGLGTVFSLKPNPDGSWTQTVIYSFTASGDGRWPYGGVIRDSQGNLYGTTSFGGAMGYGTVFMLAPQPDGSWTATILYSFTGGIDGSEPYTGLVLDTKGNLYGTTYLGGTSGLGTVFQLTSSGGHWTETVLHNFHGGSDGYNPHQAPVLDQAGNLYGTTEYGGSGICDNGGAGCGVVFELKHSPDFRRWRESILHSFSGPDGSNPRGGRLLLDTKGNLFGLGYYGGAHDAGVVFQLRRSQSGWTEKVLYDFVGSDDGYRPSGGLVLGAGHVLFGSAPNGGSGGNGTVFKVTPSGGNWTLRVVHSFSYTDGANPDGLFLGANGHLYGVGYSGGTYGAGVVFEVKP